MEIGVVIGIIGTVITVTAYLGSAIWVIATLKSSGTALRQELSEFKRSWTEEAQEMRREMRELVGEVRGDLKLAETEIRKLGQQTSALTARERELDDIRNRIGKLEPSGK